MTGSTEERAVAPGRRDMGAFRVHSKSPNRMWVDPYGRLTGIVGGLVGVEERCRGRVGRPSVMAGVRIRAIGRAVLVAVDQPGEELVDRTAAAADVHLVWCAHLAQRL